MPLGAKPGRGTGLREYRRAIGPQQRKPLPQFLFRHVSRASRHGARVTLTHDYAMIVHGRSGATLNRGGMRMGGSDIYDAVETVSDIPASLAVSIKQCDDVDWTTSLVSPARSAVSDDRPQSAIRVAIPDGVKRILLERQADVVDLGAVDRPDVLVEIGDLAAARSPS